MLEKLSGIPTEKLALVRHVRVPAKDLVSFSRRHIHMYPLAQTLQLLPGLKLHRLTVLVTSLDPGTFYFFINLIEAASGWKELYFILCDSKFLGSRFLGQRPLFQSVRWQKLLESRDGRASKPSVAIYCTKSPAFEGAIMHPDKRIPFEQNLAPGQNLADSSKMEDLSPCAKDERKKELLVIVKRGKGVDYEQRDTLNRYFEGRRLCSWKDIQEIQKEVPKEEKIHAQFGRIDHTDDSYPVEVDNYADVDDYQY